MGLEVKGVYSVGEATAMNASWATNQTDKK